MTQLQRNLFSPPTIGATKTGPSFHEVVSTAMHGLRRNAILIAATTLAFICVAILTIANSTPIYTAATTIYIDPRQSSGFQEAGGILLNSDALLVDTEIEILRSPALVQDVVTTLGLTRNPPEISTSPIGSVKKWLGGLLATNQDVGVLSIEDAATRRAVSNLLQNSSVARRDNTYVIEIKVQNSDKLLAAKIANTYADQYLKSQLDVHADRLEQLSGRSVAALSQALSTMQDAAEKVNQFRLENGIESEGRQVVEAELLEVNNSLVNMRQQRFNDELQFERVKRVLEIGDMGSTIETDIPSEKIASLRTQILEIEIELVRLTASGSGKSPQAIHKTAELAAIKSELNNEYSRLKNQLQSKIDFSIQEEELLGSRVAKLRQQVAVVADNEVRLRELEMRSDSERTVYQVLLQRFYETSEELTFQTNDARVLTTASVPAGPSAPAPTKILLLGIVGGLFVGIGMAFVREQLNDGMRAPSEIEGLGLKYLGAAPVIRRAWLGRTHTARQRAKDIRWPKLAGIKGDFELAKLNYAVDNPMSEFSETIRSIVFDAASRPHPNDGGKVIAVTSVHANEGKTLIAANLAAYFAKQGKRVHLIDFDLRSPTLSRLFADRAAEVHQSNPPANAFANSPPMGANGPQDYRFSGLMANAAATDLIQYVDPHAISVLLEESRQKFDVVILDTAPLNYSSDARVGANLADQVIMAVQWGKTTAAQIEQALMRGQHLKTRSIGAVFNSVSASEIGQKSDASYAGELHEVAV